MDLFLLGTEDYKDNTLNYYDCNMRLNFRLTPKDFLAVSFFHGRDNMGIDELMDMKWSNTAATVNWLHTFGDHHYANTNLIYSDFNDDVGIEIFNTRYRMKGYIRHLTLNHSQVLEVTETNKLNYGLESTYLQLKSAEWDINLLHEKESRKAWTSALWLNDEWKIGRALELSAGLRLHLFSVLGGSPYYDIDFNGDIQSTINPASGSFVKTYADLEPRVSVKVPLGRHNSLKFGYSRTSQDIHAIRAGSMSMPFDRYTMTSNIVKPEQADQVALGWAGITANGSYDFSAETYAMSMIIAMVSRSIPRLRLNDSSLVVRDVPMAWSSVPIRTRAGLRAG